MGYHLVSILQCLRSWSLSGSGEVERKPAAVQESENQESKLPEKPSPKDTSVTADVPQKTETSSPPAAKDQEQTSANGQPSNGALPLTPEEEGQETPCTRPDMNTCPAVDEVVEVEDLETGVSETREQGNRGKRRSGACIIL